MKKTYLFYVTAFLLIFSLSVTAFAHSGRTDSSGGHKDNKNASGLGSYHYHHGNGPHLHSNGVCPYNAPTNTPTPITTPKPTIVSVPSPKPIKVMLNNEAIEFDQQPEIINSRVMVPIRYVVEKMGCKIEWDSSTQTVYINTADNALEKTAAKTSNINVFVNNEQIVFEDQQPINKNGRVLIPIRFVTEKLEYKVNWDSALKTVTIVKE